MNFFQIWPRPMILVHFVDLPSITVSRKFHVIWTKIEWDIMRTVTQVYKIKILRKTDLRIWIWKKVDFQLFSFWFFASLSHVKCKNKPKIKKQNKNDWKSTFFSVFQSSKPFFSKSCFCVLASPLLSYLINLCTNNLKFVETMPNNISEV